MKRLSTIEKTAKLVPVKEHQGIPKENFDKAISHLMKFVKTGELTHLVLPSSLLGFDPDFSTTIRKLAKEYGKVKDLPEDIKYGEFKTNLLRSMSGLYIKDELDDILEREHKIDLMSPFYG